MWFKRRKPYTRSAILEAADKAQARGKLRRAVAEYQKVLEVDPNDHVTHGKVAPLLAETNQLAEAWSSFVAAGEGYLREGFVDKALSIYKQAARFLPRRIEVWETIARLEVERGRRGDAVKALLDGRHHFRRRNLRPLAIRLMRQACAIQPWHFEATLNLARLLAKAGKRREVRWLLDGLAERERGCKLRRVRGALFWMSPTPAAAWRWLRAAIAGDDTAFR